MASGTSLKLEEQWVEVVALLVLVVGFVLSIFLFNPVYSYLVVLFSGFLVGRIYYLLRYKEPLFPTIIIIVGFLIGYLLGGFWGSRLLILIFFGVGFGISYYLHLKKILVKFKSEEFIK